MRRIRQRLHSVFQDAQFHGRCTGNPAAAITEKLRKAKPRPPAQALRHLPYRDAPALMARIRATPGTAARCLEFAVLCAARTGEAIGATWSEINVDAGIWRVDGSRMKGGEAHTVYLSPAALAVLAVQRGQHSTWVFPSPADLDKPLSNLAMLVLLEGLGVRDQTTVYGLARGTFSTFANETAAARPDVVECCNVYPQEAESILIGHPKVADVAVIGVPSEDLGEEVKAVVQLLDPSNAGPDMEAELLTYCRQRLAACRRARGNTPAARG